MEDISMKKLLILATLIIFIMISSFTLLAADSDIDYEIYEVKSGETFQSICKVVLLDVSMWKQLLKYNNLNKPTEVVPGTKLKIPNALSKNRYAKVQFVSGKVEVSKNGEDWEKIRNNHVLVEGDWLKTKDDSKCEIKLDDGTLLKLESNTFIGLGEFDYEGGDKTLLQMLEGSVLMKITKLGDGDEFGVDAVSAVAGVRGTEFKVTVTPGGNDKKDSVVEIEVLEGKVAAKAKDNPNSEEELVLESSTGNNDTTAEQINDEGGATDINQEKTIEVAQGFTLQFNWKQDQAIVTKVPQQIEEVVIEELDEEGLEEETE
jgi:hypothetical protein